MKILFITHETTRTGAPIVLLHFLNWLKVHKAAIEVYVLSLKKGELNDEFIKLSERFYDYEEHTKSSKLSLADKVLIKFNFKKVKNKATVLFKMLSEENFDFIYANTIKSIPIGTKIRSYTSKIKLIAHIHELNVIINQLLPNFNEYQNEINHFIVPSNLVKHNLEENWGILSEKISCVYECSEVPFKNTRVSNDKDNFLIGGSGTVHWRKGYDLFIQVARYIKVNYPDRKIHFTWVGKLYDLEKHIIAEDLRKLDLKKTVTFIGEKQNPSTHYNMFDVFLMTSREDPFPLVCIEVGMLGKPIISFDKATGSNELIALGGGYIVPYLDVEAMAKKIIYYYDNPDKKLAHGQINTEAFSKCTPDEICPSLHEILENRI